MDKILLDKRLRIIITTVTLFITSLNCLAQDTTAKNRQVDISQTRPINDTGNNIALLKGIVLDTLKNPIIGATILIKGSNKQTLTANDGSFTLTNVNRNDKIIVSGIGIQKTEYAVNNFLANPVINITFDISQLENVNIISNGYQKIRRERLTGSVVKIDSTVIHQNISINGDLLNLLEGKLSGLVYDPKAGEVSVRGISTLTPASRNPLIILDGFPVELDINQINPKDIVSINVLKDAAAAAIYGVRASNGVIIIESRVGKSGAPQVQASVNYSVFPNASFSKYNYLTGADYIQAKIAGAKYNIANGLTKEGYYDYNNLAYTPILGITDDLINNRITQSQADELYAQYAAYNNSKDFQRLFMQTANSQSADFNISGGSGGEHPITYYFGANYQKNNTQFKDNNNTRITLNFNSSYEISKIFTLNFKTYYTTGGSYQKYLPPYRTFEAYEKFVDDNGNALPVFAPASYPNIGTLRAINESLAQNAISKGLYDPRNYPYLDFKNKYTNTNINNFRVIGDLRTKIFNGLNFLIGGSYEKQTNLVTDYTGEMATETRIAMNLYTLRDPGSGKPIFQFPQGAIQKSTDYLLSSYTIRTQLDFNRTFNKHIVTVLLGTEARKIVNQSSMNTLFGYDDNALLSKPFNMSLLTGRPSSPFTADFVPFGTFLGQYYLNSFINNTYSDDRYFSMYGNGSYTFNNKYTATGSFRIDQSNLFGKDPKFRYTPLWSAGVRWSAKKEKFLENINWLYDLSVRSSIGYNGNTANTSGPFTVISRVNNISAGPNPIIGSYISSPLNTSLRWEKIYNFNTGIDISLLENKMLLSIDYYLKHAKDLLATMDIDPTYGVRVNAITSNNAEVRNRGIEISLNTTNISNKNFDWNTSVSSSFNKNEVLSYNYNIAKTVNSFIGTAASSYPVIGKPLYPVYSYNYAGLDNNGRPMVYNDNGEEIVQSDYGTAPGNGSGLTPAGLIYEGSRTPRYVIGLNNQLRYKKLSMSINIIYYGGFVGFMPAAIINSQNPIKGSLNYWQSPGDEAQTQIPGFPGAFGTPTYYNATDFSSYQYSHQLLKRFDYIAIRNITLNYQLTNNLLNKIGLRNSLLRAQIQNPYKFVLFAKGIDPETADGYGTPSLPIMPGLTFSFSTNF